jgi:phosphate transport system substrate-binding protein
MVNMKSSSGVALALLSSTATVFVSVLGFWVQSAQAQFPVDQVFTPGDLKGTIKIDGSSSMAVVNQALKQKIEAKSGKVETAYNGSDDGIKALLDGKVDLAAIGRPLTDAEKAKGLVAVPVVRDKIAILVGADNPYAGNMTIYQFAKIFRGEITDWSKAGGPPGPIRLVDLPSPSDTRNAFKPYPVFKEATFKAGGKVLSLKEDSTAAVAKALGKDGIGYAIANQVKEIPGVKIVTMHKTQPTDPRYPFSQALTYVYKGEPSESVKAFLGYATNSAGQAAITAARAAETDTVAAGKDPLKDAKLVGPKAVEQIKQEAASAAKEAVATGTDAAAKLKGAGTDLAGQAAGAVKGGNLPGLDAEKTGLGWWWLLPAALLGGGALWLAAARRRPEDAGGVIGAVEPEQDTVDHGFRFPTVNLPTVKLPGTGLPNANLPDVNLPDVNLPSPGGIGPGGIGGVIGNVAGSIKDAGVGAIAGAGAIAGGAIAAGAGALSGAFKKPEDQLDVNLPEGNLDLSLPDANLPNIQAPDMNLPDVNAPNLNLGEMSLPDVNLPDVNLPDVNLPDVNLPNINGPEVNLPDVNLGKIEGGPGNLVSGVVDGVKDAGVGALAGGAAIAGGAVAAGAGALSWLRDRGSDGVDATREAAGTVTDAAGNVVGNVVGKTQDVAGKAADRLTDGLSADGGDIHLIDEGDWIDAEAPAAPSFWDRLKGKVADAVGGTGDRVEKTIADVRDQTGNAIDQLPADVTAPMQDLASGASNLLEGGETPGKKMP